MLKKFIIMTTVLMTLSLSVLAVESSEQPQTYKDKIPEFLSYLGERKEPIELSYRADTYNYNNKLFNEIIDPTVNKLMKKSIPLQRRPLSVFIPYMDSEIIYGFDKVYSIIIKIPFEDQRMLSYIQSDLNKYLRDSDWTKKCKTSEAVSAVLDIPCQYIKDKYSIIGTPYKKEKFNYLYVYLTDISIKDELVSRLDEQEKRLKKELLKKEKEERDKLEEESFNKFQNAIRID